MGNDEITFDLGGLDTAMEAGGPMGRSHRRSIPNGDSDDSKEHVIEGREPPIGHPNHIQTVPSSGSHMTSGLGKELSADRYAKPKSGPLSSDHDDEKIQTV